MLLVVGCAAPPHSTTTIFERDTYIGSLKVVRTFGHFTEAASLSFDGLGDLYVVDSKAPGIYKFSSSGDSLHAIIALGSAHGQFDAPADIDASLTNAVAVADKNNNRIELYSRDLIWQASIEGHRPASGIQFSYPIAVRAAPSGYYYIIDAESSRLLALDPVRGLQQEITTRGSSLGLTMKPQSIAIDAGEYIDVADANFRSLLQFNNTLTPITQIKFSPANTSRLSTNGEELLVFEPNANTVRLFNFRELRYDGSYSLPSAALDAVAIYTHGNYFYILTKKEVIVCTVMTR